MGLHIRAIRTVLLVTFTGPAFFNSSTQPPQSKPDALPRVPRAHPVPPAPIRLRPLALRGSATTTSLTISPASVEAGTPVTLTATVTSEQTPVSAGIVEFCNQAFSTCSSPGQPVPAVLGRQGKTTRVLVLPAGTYLFAAHFEGTALYASSTSAGETLTVEPNSTYPAKLALTSVTGSKGRYSLGASLSSHGAAAPAGSIAFTDTTSGNKLGSVSLKEAALGGYQPFGLISTGAKSGPNDLVCGDFNNDGIPDFAVPDSATGVVAIFLGKGDGTFQPTANTSTGNGSMPLALAAGDFNGDGNLDLAVALGNPAGAAILLGNGNGTFAPARMVSTADSALFYPVALTIGDFNHDGRLDIATANNSTGVSILLGNGDGSFQPYRFVVCDESPTWIAAGDFNNDGDLDLAVTTASNTVDVLLGNGDGTFALSTSISLGAGVDPQSVAAADLDGDGKIDLVLACYGANALGVLPGNGDGTFLPVEFYAAGAGSISVVIGDLNLDGIPDVVVTNLNSNSLSVFQGNGDGTFLPMPGYSTTRNSQPAASVVADLDADGTPEIVTVLYASSALYVLEMGRIQGVLMKNVPLSTTGTISLTATYSGDDLYAPATSAFYQHPGSAAGAASAQSIERIGAHTGSGGGNPRGALTPACQWHSNACCERLRVRASR